MDADANYSMLTSTAMLPNFVIMKNSSEILQLFAKNVRTTRILQGVSQEKLAERAGLHRTYIGMIERAEKNITLKNIAKIAFALKVKPESLLSNNPHNNDN